MKENIKKKLPIVLSIVTVLLLAANYIFTGNSFQKQQMQSIELASLEEKNITDGEYRVMSLPKEFPQKDIPFSLALSSPDYKKEYRVKEDDIPLSPTLSPSDSKMYLENFMKTSEEERALINHKTITTSEPPTGAAKGAEDQSDKKGEETKDGKNLINLSASDIQKILSGTLLLCALAIILFNRNNDTLQKWAFGVIGSLIGFWLK